MPCAKSPCCKASKAEVNALMQQMYHLTIVEHKLNDSFSHCDHRMNLPCDAVTVPIVITCVLIYLFILDKL